jgi:pimeloyl-ACP methyl ester carboxylesterase
MWLRDHLPQDLRAVKVSIWGNQSSLDNSNSEAGLADYTENFLQDVRISRMRRGLKRLPLILVGHSMGGLIAKAVSMMTPLSLFLTFRTTS